MKEIQVVLCGNKQQCRFYFEEKVKTFTKEQLFKTRVDAMNTQISNDHEFVVFLSPAEVLTYLRGMKVSKVIEKGTPYDHPKYSAAVRFLKERAIQ